jgi:hypothetical protein
MEYPSLQQAANNSREFPSPPRIHWAVLLGAIVAAEAASLWLVPRQYREFVINVVTAAWPIYLCFWIRKIDPKSTSLYWALASFVTGFLFSWVLWIVVIFEIREELLDHYNRREPIGLRLNFLLTFFFSFFYFQYALNKITKEKELDAEGTETEPDTSVSA